MNTSTRETISVYTPNGIAGKIAEDFRQYRKIRKLPMTELAKMSGVGYSTIKKFEHTGEISLVSLCKIASVLGLDDALLNLFSDIPPATIEEVF